MTNANSEPVPVAPPLGARRRRADEVNRMRDLLRMEIVAGRYDRQALLPAEPELMLAYAVSRNVVRDSLDLLRAEGLIERIQGSGTFVLVEKARHQLDRVHAINDSITRPGWAGGTILTNTTVLAPAVVAEYLGIAPGDECAFLEYTATLGSAPFSVSTSYLPLPAAEKLLRGEFRGDFYQFLESSGLPVGAGELVVEAVAADGRSAAVLDIAEGAPLVLFHRRLTDVDGHPLEIGFVRCRADQLILQTRLPRMTRPDPTAKESAC